MDKDKLKQLMLAGVPLAMLLSTHRRQGHNGRKCLNLPCHCGNCGCDIPPGKEGRLFRTCRENLKPQVEN